MSSEYVIDFETLDLSSDAVAPQVAIVDFDPDALTINRVLDLTINPEKQLGRTCSTETLLWWMKQDAFDAVVRPAFNSNITQEGAALRINEFMQCDKNTKVWCRGQDFDIPIMKSFLGGNIPWSFWNSRDIRTMVGALGVSKPEPVEHLAKIRDVILTFLPDYGESRIGKHNALVDAVGDTLLLMQGLDVEQRKNDAIANLTTELTKCKLELRDYKKAVKRKPHVTKARSKKKSKTS